MDSKEDTDCYGGASATHRPCIGDSRPPQLRLGGGGKHYSKRYGKSRAIYGHCASTPGFAAARGKSGSATETGICSDLNG